MIPGADDVDAKYLMRLESRPLADDGMTPGDYMSSTPGQHRRQQDQHPLSDAVRARYVDQNPRRAVVTLKIPRIIVLCTFFLKLAPASHIHEC